MVMPASLSKSSLSGPGTFSGACAGWFSFRFLIASRAVEDQSYNMRFSPMRRMRQVRTILPSLCHDPQGGSAHLEFCVKAQAWFSSFLLQPAQSDSENGFPQKWIVQTPLPEAACRTLEDCAYFSSPCIYIYRYRYTQYTHIKS